ncbi:MAG: InlB B-repeat-containing protein [Saezia sp.]
MPKKTTSDTYFNYADTTDVLKNRLIKALARIEGQNASIRCQTAGYGQPLWDYCWTVTESDSSVYFLTPIYDSLSNMLTGIWAFHCLPHVDSAYYAINWTPSALEDKTFAWDINIVFDIFRFWLNLPTERNILNFLVKNEDKVGTKLQVFPEPPGPSVTCTRACILVGPLSGTPESSPTIKSTSEEWKCTTDCKVTRKVVFETSDKGGIIISGGGGGGGDSGGGNGGGTSQQEPCGVTTTAVGKGSVTGGGIYPKGSKVTISATAKAGYQFMLWRSSTGEFKAATYTITVDKKDEYYTAYFEPHSDPCGKADSLGFTSDTELQSELRNRMTEAADTTTRSESGYLKQANGNKKEGEGQGAEVKLDREPGEVYTECIHTHPTSLGGKSFPSFGDLEFLHNLMVDGQIKDIPTFRYGIVGANEVTFLVIKDAESFRKFGILANLEEDFKKNVTSLRGNSSEFLARTIDFFKVKDAGIEVVQGKLYGNEITWSTKDAKTKIEPFDVFPDGKEDRATKVLIDKDCKK